jgi:hypothetical protein
MRSDSPFGESRTVPSCPRDARSQSAENRVLLHPEYWRLHHCVPRVMGAMTGFIASAFLSRNRVSLKEAFEGLELCDGL